MEPSLATDPYGVTLVGEALGAEEAKIGKPFQGRAGFKLTRLIEFAGFKRERFDIVNTIWCQPPDNDLSGEPYELGSIKHCRDAHWERLLARSKVLVPLGNVPLNAILGIRGGILERRGYVYHNGTHLVVPTVHPSFIQRGNSRWSAPFIADLQKSVQLAREGYTPQFTNYVLDPRPIEAYNWALEYRRFLASHPDTYLAFDIETPYKAEDEEDNDGSDDLPDSSWNIERIGFSYRGLTALSIPWEPPFFAAIRTLLGSVGPKVVWNAGFDVPRIRRMGFEIKGIIHDGMIAWHILHSDLPKKLAFVATFTCPFQPAWKHLSGSKPAFYNATDADVELRSMEVIEKELRENDLWDVYVRDVVELDPILAFMHSRGMPIDERVREDRARDLQSRYEEVRGELEGLFPVETRKIEHVYKRAPNDTSGLLSREAELPVTVCDNCGTESPRKDHFKAYKKKHNPCANRSSKQDWKRGVEWFRLSEFSPSRDQLIRYHKHLNRANPMVYDKKQGKQKVSFGQEQMMSLIGKYPLDPVYKLVLKYREIEKLQGTYVGRPFGE